MDADSVDWNLCLGGSATTTCAKALIVYVQQKSLVTCYNSQVLVFDVFYWLAIHSNRYWPHNIGFLLPPICPHRRPRKFQVIGPRLYLRRLENLESLGVHRDDNPAFKLPSHETNITAEFSFILYILLVKYGEKGRYWLLVKRMSVLIETNILQLLSKTEPTIFPIMGQPHQSTTYWYTKRE